MLNEINIEKFKTSSGYYIIPILYNKETIKEIKERGGKYIPKYKRWLIKDRETAEYFLTKGTRGISE